MLAEVKPARASAASGRRPGALGEIPAPHVPQKLSSGYTVLPHQRQPPRTGIPRNGSEGVLQRHQAADVDEH